MGQARKNVNQLIQLQMEIEDFIRSSQGEGRSRGHGEQVHIPQMDVYETGEYLMIDVDLPGVRKEDISCYISREQILVEARKRPSNPEKSAHYFCMERFFGLLRREIEITTIVNTQLVKAKFENGILRLRLPKIADRREKRRKVEIE